ncbi:hypothetical protein [Paraburkholderia caballeronis]|uniref:Uncharacterized protein n=1 Tax=Paraburkholderia caballeronis TaxID=416943 RepID=A0A1H7L1X7_9BURK|nr:hypothetical protein [Paraburkholderia caballeronis]PXW28252.1 hypothetical protein C7403_102144 [Paraburkholderia caballeronis]PXX03618.1 hypothetical protein C7407_102144 [Paraburkholderia caballeronis]RAK04362.1 hypothetical protein C7409_102144 [Paraburkholderia caballeronis]SED83223.1 hypothetical protein SAMN05445871_4035 [Paraburkholderia caballeronis]SEK92790.1 hypothetical protein SAMN05192542_104144 [Paraburkholderia caballeronis]
MSVDGGSEQTAEHGSGGSEGELSLREELSRNLADIQAAQQDATSQSTTQAAAAPTSADGAPSAGTESTAVAAPAHDTSAATATDPAKAKPPASWKATEQAHWEKIPPEAQAVIARREEEVHSAITRLGADASVGRKFAEAVTPYLPTIRAEGGEPIAAVRDLLQTAYVLRAGDAEQRVALFRQLAQQFRVDLNQVAQGQQQVDPQVQSLQQQLARVNGFLATQQQQQHQQTQGVLHNHIAAFAADPGHEFFEQVRPVMASLLNGGVAKDLQEAYDMACNANPDVRSTLLTRQQASDEAKRAAEAKAKADAKRRAGVSISGSPGATVSKTAADPDRSLRDELRANLRAVTS